MMTQDSHIDESVAVVNEAVTFRQLAVEASVWLQHIPDDFNSAYGIDGCLGTSSFTGTTALSLDTLHRFLSLRPPIAFLNLVPETQKHHGRKVISGSAEMRAVGDAEIKRPPEMKLLDLTFWTTGSSHVLKLVAQLPDQMPCTVECCLYSTELSS
jgi:hypothetical protein